MPRARSTLFGRSFAVAEWAPLQLGRAHGASINTGSNRSLCEQPGSHFGTPKSDDALALYKSILDAADTR